MAYRLCFAKIHKEFQMIKLLIFLTFILIVPGGFIIFPLLYLLKEKLQADLDEPDDQDFE